MQFKTHNETEVPFAGTHLQGYVDTTYDDLVSLFGEPVRSYPGSKVDWQWGNPIRQRCDRNSVQLEKRPKLHGTNR